MNCVQSPSPTLQHARRESMQGISTWHGLSKRSVLVSCTVEAAFDKLLWNDILPKTKWFMSPQVPRCVCVCVCVCLCVSVCACMHVCIKQVNKDQERWIVREDEDVRKDWRLLCKCLHSWHMYLSYTSPNHVLKFFLLPRCAVRQAQGPEFRAGVGWRAVVTYPATSPFPRHPGGASGHWPYPAGCRDQAWKTVCVGGIA